MMRTKHTYMVPSLIRTLRDHTLEGDLKNGVLTLAFHLSDERYIEKKAESISDPITAEETEMLQDMLDHMLARTDWFYQNGEDIRAAFEQGNEHMCFKEMKRQLKAKVMYFDKSDNSIWEIKVKPTEENLAYYKRVHEKESEETAVTLLMLSSMKKDWIWMNDLPEDMAFYYWKKADKANKDKKNA